ncbi:MAG: gliding motility-associated C-terminal domain-containing protein [Flavobacteriales bacterium]|nr:gliding motility-associated C-terminal domain-containing protein [Flavobacteriales bacterium]
MLPLLGMLLGTGAIQAQPICSIDIGDDHTICQGETVQLNGPAGFPNYLWSNGAITQNTTVGTAGTYTCQVSYPSGELVTNGNFTSGNTGFSTEFTYNTNLNLGDGHIFVGSNAASHHPQFSGTGNGNFLIVNAGWAAALFMVWCQDVVVCPGQTYTLSYRARTISNATPARLQWWIGGVPVGPEVNLPAFNAGWQTINQTFTTPAGMTNATICLRVMSGEGVGNDFGLDDISMQGTVVLTDQVEVFVTPLPVFDLGPEQSLCDGQTATLNATVPGGSYLWQDGSTDPTYTVSTAGLYSVTVTANGCPASDNVNFIFNPLPVVDLGADLSLCDGQTVTLDATVPGATYGWSTGANTPTYTVSGPGTFGVNVSLNGCLAYDAVNVFYDPIPVVDLGNDLTVCEGVQVMLDVGTPGGSYLWQDGSTDPTFSANTSGTYSVQVTVNGCTGSDAMDISVTPAPVVDLGPDQTVCPGTSVLLNATAPGATYLWQDGSTDATFTASTPGTYTVTVTANNCPNTDSFTLNNHPLPPVDLGPDQTICQGATTTLSANSPGSSLVWSTGALTPTITTGTAGIYWVDATQNGCTVRDSLVLSVTPLPVVDLGVAPTVCPGGQVTLNATTAGATYLWNTGATTATISATPGPYNVQVTVNGCSSTASVIVGSHPAAQVDLGNDATLCSGESATLNVFQAGASYLWQDGSTAPTFTVTTPGTYSVTLTDANGCAANDAVNISYADQIVVDLGPDAVVCQGSVLLLDVGAPGATYLWNTGAITPTLSVSTAGTYEVTVTMGSCSATDAISVVVLPAPVVDLGPDQTVCPGTSVLLNATLPGATYLWQDGSNAATFNASAPGNYSVTVTVNGCPASDTFTLSNHPLPAVDLGPDQTICQSTTTTLSANSPGSSLVWSTGALTPTITTGTAGIYWVDATQNGCTVRDSLVLSVTPLPVVDLGVAPSVCPGGQVTLNATTAGATYLWSTGATTATISATPGDYDVQVTVNGCSSTAAVTVGAYPAAQVDLGNDATLCSGESTTLNVFQAGASYLWQDGSTGPSLTVTTPGTYTVTLTDANGCVASDAVDISFTDPIVVDLGPDQVICQGDVVDFDVTLPGATYLWNTGALSPTLSVNATGTYTVTVSVGACSASDVVDVQVVNAPNVDLGPDLLLCTGESTVLDASVPGATYLWNTGATTATLNVDAEGTYSVTVTLASGCNASDAVNVSYQTPVSVDLGPDLSICNGDMAFLDATTPGATYLWNTGATSASINVTTAGTYSVAVDQNGCIVTDELELTVLPTPAFDLGPDVTLCLGDELLLDATSAGATYLWNTGATSATLLVSTSGTYSVTATLNSCTATDAITVTVLSADAVDLGPDITLCAGEQQVLNAAVPGATYVWSTGATTAAITVANAGTYWAEVTQSGCSASDTVVVSVNDPGSINLGADLNLCEGESATLDATLAGATYLWNTGSTNASIPVSTSGTYSVVATVGQCSVSDDVLVIVTPLPAIDLGGNVSLCPGESATFSALTMGATYLWHDGSTLATYSTSTPGPVSVTVTLNGCSATSNATVSMANAPVVDLGPNTTICAGDVLLLDAGQVGASYVWDDGSTGATRSVDEAGTYWVEVLRDGCSRSDTVVVSVFNPAALDLGPDLFLCPGGSADLSTGVVGASHTWSTGANTTSISVDQAGTYWVEVQVAGCTASDTVVVQAVEFPVIDLGGDRTICAGEQVTLSVAPGSAAVLWSTGGTANSIAVGSTGLYSVTLSDQGCSTSASVSINVLPVITLIDLGPTTSLCPGATLLLDAGLPTNASYTWSTGGTGPLLNVERPGTYTVVATGQCVEATGSIVILPGECGTEVHVPNAFTPNGDGINDVFLPIISADVADYRLTIFDRWGEVIHESTDQNAPWDGRAKGKEAQDEVYVWVLEFRTLDNADVRRERRVGHVTLLR